MASGFQINRAGDDVAGLAISEKMRGQIRGLNMAGKNIRNGISLVQTAEGALHEVSAILQRARELSVQAVNDTNEAMDRAALQKEMTQLVGDVDRIAETTEFNTQQLFKAPDKKAAVQVIDHVTTVVDMNWGLTQMKSSKDGGLLGVYSGIAGKFDANGTQQWAFSIQDKRQMISLKHRTIIILCCIQIL